jgi:catechol 2,3-dioxygenase-like lactoylglutathione lyase family enzyme
VTSRLTEVIIDCHDLERMAAFWSAVLGYQRGRSGEGWASIHAAGGPPGFDALLTGAVPPIVAFVLVPEDKSVKNRVHLDVTPVECSQDAEVERLIALGAARADIGQDETPWVVMADPEGNEFCVMPAAEPD